LDYANGPNINAELAAAAPQTLIDGGTSNFTAGQVLRTMYGLNTDGVVGGHGDTLQLQGTAALDFSILNATNKITGIERIDLSTSTQVQNVTLNYNDIFKLTDQHHTLVINVGFNDTLNLNGPEFAASGGMHKVLDNVAIDDAAQGGSADVK